MRLYSLFVIDGSPYKEMYEFMLLDVAKDKSSEILVDKKNDSIMKKILLKNKIRGIIGDRLDCIVYEKNNLYKKIQQVYDKHDYIIVIFLNSALYYNNYLPDTLLRYKIKWPKLKYVLYYLDIMSHGVSSNANLLNKNGIFDLVYTIEKKDAIENNFIKWNTIYSLNDNYKNYEKHYDLYFCGAIKNRNKIIEEIYRSSKRKNIDIRMDIVISSDKDNIDKSLKDRINIYNKTYLPYSSVLKAQVKSNCILEILQPGQTALTLRPYEAVLYNRKLLTNSENILEFKYYDSRYMKYFQRVEDIDWEWVKDRSDIKYNYKNEFSPYYLISDIKRRLNYI